MKKSVLTNQQEVLFLMYSILQRYYAGIALQWGLQEWSEVCKIMERFRSFTDSSDRIEEAIRVLSTVDEEQVKQLPFDFNRLFVGPDKLLASPYESSYRNADRSLMQLETLRVRNFYARAGLEVTKKSVEPDDHLALELEFVCYLLANLDQEGNSELYQEFLHQHLAVWIGQHCEDIHNHTTHPICKSMAYLLEELIGQERGLQIASTKGGTGS